jgi:CPA1 family monovalent cation:H+ antiporter
MALICLSSVVHRFLPVISAPIIQIVLGALVTFLPFDPWYELDPELFFVLFVAPLIFYISLLADKRTMWTQRKPILNLGVLLAFVTIAIAGYLVNMLIPSIPIAAAFVLVTALVPTDDIVVTALGKRANVPPKIMTIVQGEGIINDASGIVCFQFALVAMLTGSFSLINATGRFLIVGLGGVAVGLIFTWLKYILVRWIRSLGMENVTLHLMFGLITPFVIYMIAERLDVSGILAVAAAGIAHSFNRDKFSPENANFNIASDSIWSMLAFTLEGLVFVIMGTQLPKILASIQEQIYSITAWEIGAYILLITLLLMLLRFIWSVLTIKKKVFNDAKHPVSRIRAGIIISLSGTRGAITLASVMSIPLLLSDGTAFPERGLIIIIAAGVIVVSLLITSFILPLCIEKKEKADKSHENQAYIEILQNVIKEIKVNAVPDDEEITAAIISNYYNRIAKLQRKQSNRRVDREEEIKLRITIYNWEKENIVKILKSGDTNERAAQFYLSILNNQIEKLLQNRFDFRRIIFHFFHQSHKIVNPKERVGLRSKIFDLMEVNTHFVLEKLREMSHTHDSSAIRKVMENYELRQYMYQRGLQHSKHNKEHFVAVLTHSFQIERDNIQAMFELGRISRETVKEMRHNISLLEIQLKKEYF